MSWKKMIFGEKMPDKDDPKYKERYGSSVSNPPDGGTHDCHGTPGTIIETKT